jgi:hypothetical protein
MWEMAMVSRWEYVKNFLWAMFTERYFKGFSGPIAVAIAYFLPNLQDYPYFKPVTFWGALAWLYVAVVLFSYDYFIDQLGKAKPVAAIGPALALEFRDKNKQFLRSEREGAECDGEAWKYAGYVMVRNDSDEAINDVRIVIGGIYPSKKGNYFVGRHYDGDSVPSISCAS